MLYVTSVYLRDMIFFSNFAFGCESSERLLFLYAM